MSRSRAALFLLLAPGLSCTSMFSCSSQEQPSVVEAPEATSAVTRAPIRLATPTPPPAPVSPEAASGGPMLHDDHTRESLVEALDQSLTFLSRTTESELDGCPLLEVERALFDLRELAKRGGPIGAYADFRFHARKVEPEARVTGYYEPVVDGRLQREEPYVYPLYRRPDDLVEVPLPNFGKLYGRVVDGRLQPYYTRREIDAEAKLAGRGLELAWLADPVDRFFLQIQGSGIIRLDDGRKLRVGYASTNGHPYTSIGRLMLDQGLLAPGEASAPAMQRWLRRHPDLRDEVLFQNHRYVFFRETRDGPIGSLGVRLTPGRSVAIDRESHPGAMLGWLETRVPEVAADGSILRYRPLRRFVLAQDAGAAIAGPGRLDLFFGSGPEAGQIAGNLHEPGELWLLSPCETTTPPPSIADRTGR